MDAGLAPLRHLKCLPNEIMQRIHNRMPAILAPQDYDLWLDPTVQQTDALQVLLKPYPTEVIEAYPVSRLVNNPRFDGPQCLEQLDTVDAASI